MNLPSQYILRTDQVATFNLIPSNLDKLAKGTPAFTIVSVCVCLATKDKFAKQNVKYLSNHWSDLLHI